MNPALPITNQELKTRAFTHRSYLNESGAPESNERLEYLGDAVLELAVSEFLFHKFTDKPEGELTALRAALVKTTTLAQVAKTLNLGEQLLMSKGEVQTGGRSNQSLLANTFEAVLGAIYLDSGYATAKEFLTLHLFPLLENILTNNLYKDFKSTYQETIQSQGRPTPRYQQLEATGPDHDKIFTMALFVGDDQITIGHGKSKQQAEQDAAKKALALLDEA